MNKQKRYFLQAWLTREDLEDLECILGAVDGYYTPSGSNALRLLIEFQEKVENLLGEADKEGEEV
jgi:hypothetical protein